MTENRALYTTWVTTIWDVPPITSREEEFWDKRLDP